MSQMEKDKHDCDKWPHCQLTYGSFDLPGKVDNHIANDGNEVSEDSFMHVIFAQIMKS